jgi:hypothetical protein
MRTLMPALLLLLLPLPVSDRYFADSIFAGIAGAGAGAVADRCPVLHRVCSQSWPSTGRCCKSDVKRRWGTFFLE